MIKITGWGLFISLSCLPCLLRLLDFFLRGLLAAPGAKQSSYRNSRHVNLCSVFVSDQLTGSSAKHICIFFLHSTFLQSFPQRQFLPCGKKTPYYFSALTDKPPIGLQTLWEPAFLHKHTACTSHSSHTHTINSRLSTKTPHLGVFSVLLSSVNGSLHNSSPKHYRWTYREV